MLKKVIDPEVLRNSYSVWDLRDGMGHLSATDAKDCSFDANPDYLNHAISLVYSTNP